MKPALWIVSIALVLLGSGSVQAQTHRGPNIPIPEQITGEQDDRVATLWWNGFPKWGNDNPAGISGYQVQWGLIGQALNHTSYVAYPIVQLQPLDNGKPYVAVIRAVDAYGNLSSPSNLVHFTGSSRRVDALRKQMNGFFDDFNLPAGPVDELKWNVAVSHCNDPAKNGFFINDQYHVHSMLCTKFGDRGQIVSRPRAPFIIGGRTGTIVFDFDGAQNRDFWYLDLMPNYIDITGHVTLESAPAYPGNMLRIRQNGNVVSIVWIDANGSPHQLGASPDLRDFHIKLVPNVRRHWKVQISQTRVQVSIEDKVVASGAANIPWTIGYIHWNAFSYNTQKEGQPQVLMHWDNFGFDAPPGWHPANTVHNYRTIPYNGSEFAPVTGFVPYTATIPNPDSLAHASRARLMFALQMGPSRFYSWDPQDSVSINGHKVSIPRPGGVPIDQILLVSGNPLFSEAIPISPEWIKTGLNHVTFAMKQSGVIDVHLEVEFPSSQAPPYTQPAEVAALQNLPMISIPEMTPATPSVQFRGNGDSTLQPYIYDSAQKATQWLRVSGTIQVPVTARGDVALNSNGKCCVISRIELLVDKKIVSAVSTDAQCPTLGGDYQIPLDTKSLSNGTHQVSVRCVAAKGNPSPPGNRDTHAPDEHYSTLHINVSN